METIEKRIKNNDAYVLGITKNFVIVNNNYEGLVVYYKDLSFKKDLFVDEDLVVYQLFSSEENDFVVLQDIEKEVLYSVDIETNHIEKLNWTIAVGPYYYVEDATFHLAASEAKYVFSYQNLALLEKSASEFNNNVILANNQKDILLLTDSGELVYNNHVLEVVEDADFVYSVKNNLVLKQAENALYCFSLENWVSIFEVQENLLIRSTIIDTHNIYMLINDKTDANASEIKVLPIPVDYTH
ncbi:hypothetical protein [uncultured Enterococcus sp.]|uniref:hypothetical protein n=1 Tax=uncultured Enterococcus sp. TaxID=167972 RepID=UPI002AA7AD7F|nr:hypothetical protein [uncultured Enterococcus sp.]